MKREIDLLGVHQSRNTSILEQEIRYLQEENFELCRKLDWYKKLYKAKENGSNDFDEVDELNAELERRNIEIEEKIKQNSSLEEQLNTAEGLNDVLKDSQNSNTVSVIFTSELSELEAATRRAAMLLLQCLSDQQLAKLRKKPRTKPELYAFLRSNLGGLGVLASDSNCALSAVLFGFVRERVFYSNCWAGLQLEGYMLRGYQLAIQRLSK